MTSYRKNFSKVPTKIEMKINLFTRSGSPYNIDSPYKRIRRDIHDPNKKIRVMWLLLLELKLKYRYV